MLTGILITLLVLAAVIGPIAWLVPSARQRRLARIRGRANRLGIRVRLVNAPKPAGANRSEQVAAYGLAWMGQPGDDRRALRDAGNKPWRLVLGTLDHGIHFYHRWDWASPELKAAPVWHPVLRNLLAEGEGDPLFGEIVAFENNDQGLEIHWREGLEEDAVERLWALLNALKAFGQKRSADSVHWPRPGSIQTAAG